MALNAALKAVIADFTTADGKIIDSHDLAAAKTKLGNTLAKIAEAIVALDDGDGDALALAALGDLTTLTTTDKTTAVAAINEVQAEVDAALPKAGGTMTGPIAMGAQKITGIGNAVDAQDAVSKAQLDAAVVGLLDFKGVIDCVGQPVYPAALKGDSYLVSVAGAIGGGAGPAVAVGDLILCIADNAGGTQIAVGTSWAVLEHNLLNALLAANNLSDLADAAAARGNLGLGSGALLVTDTDVALAADSDLNVPTQKAVKAYVDASGGAADLDTIYMIEVAIPDLTDAAIDVPTPLGLAADAIGFEVVQTAAGDAMNTYTLQNAGIPAGPWDITNAVPGSINIGELLRNNRYFPANRHIDAGDGLDARWSIAVFKNGGNVAGTARIYYRKTA